MKKFMIWLVILLLVGALYVNNFYISLAIKGYNIFNVHIFEESLPDTPWDYRIFQSRKNDEVVLGYAQKNSFGIWRIPLNNQMYFISEDFDLNIISWTSFGKNGMEWIVNYLIYGENAIKDIIIPEEVIPDMLEVRVYQEENKFFIHVMELDRRDDSKYVDRIYSYAVLHEFTIGLREFLIGQGMISR